MDNPYRGDGSRQPIDVGATTVLVLGILGVTACGCCAPFAWSMGNTALAQLDQAQIYDGTERSMATIGRILGIIGTLLIIAVVLFYLLVFAFTGSARR